MQCEISPCNAKSDQMKMIILNNENKIPPVKTFLKEPPENFHVAIACYFCTSDLLEKITRETSYKTPERMANLVNARIIKKQISGVRIQDVAVKCIKANMSFEQTLEEVKKVRPDSGMKMASFSWYKNKIKRGLL